MLDLLKLETFRTVANTRSFRRAGAELGYSQSTVTAHIQSLEREVGAALFDRTRFSREIALTDVGKRTLEYASRLLALAQETSVAIHSQSEPNGQLKVCVHPLLLAYRLAAVLHRYEVQYPRVRLAISAFTDPRILAGSVLNGAADISFMLDEPVATGRFNSETLGTEKLLVVCSPDHRLARLAAAVTMKQLAQDQVLFSDTNGSVRMLFERTLAGAGARIDRAVEAGSVEAVKHCAMAGIGFGVLPSFAVDAEIRKRDLVAVPILDAEMTVEIQMIRDARSWQSPAVRALWTMIRPATAMSSAA